MCTLLADGEVPPVCCCAIGLSLNGFYDDVLALARCCHIIAELHEKRPGLTLQPLCIRASLGPAPASSSFTCVAAEEAHLLLLPTAEPLQSWRARFGAVAVTTQQGLWCVINHNKSLGLE